MGKICNGVFMGGGVRGVGHAGAVKALLESGYQFDRVAGSSAGAIVAALIAAGYTGEELEYEMSNLNYLKFKGKDFITRFGIVGQLINLSSDYGIYNADYFEKWFTDLLEKKGIRTFADLEYEEHGMKKYRLQVTASDITRKKLLILPRDFKYYGLEPGEFSVAKAVRMSMSIPVFYEPYLLTDSNGNVHMIVDGGLFCNYPMWVLDNGISKLEAPVFGFQFSENKELKEKLLKKRKEKILGFFTKIISSIIDAQYAEYAMTSYGDAERTITIPVEVDGKNISSTDFDIDKKTADALFMNGYDSAKNFLSTWNFNEWQDKFRR